MGGWERSPSPGYILFRIAYCPVSFLSSSASNSQEQLAMRFPGDSAKTLLSKMSLCIDCVSFSEPDAMGNKLENVKHSFCPSAAYVLIRENSEIWKAITKHPEHPSWLATFVFGLSSLLFWLNKRACVIPLLQDGPCHGWFTSVVGSQRSTPREMLMFGSWMSLDTHMLELWSLRTFY